MIQPAAPAWTLKGKKCSIDQLNDGHKDDSPGPIYSMWDKGTKTLQQGFKTGNSQRSQINHGVLNNPSPSQYLPNNPNLLSHSVTIPKDAKLIERYKQDNPDPAAYKSNTNFVKTAYPNFSMGTKYPSIMDDTGCNPGPGDYNNPEVLMSSTMYRNSKFGTQSRFSDPNLNIPGPGHYTIGKGFVTGKNTMAKSRRSLQIKKSPGPGQYKHFDQFQNNASKNMGKTLSKKLEGCFNTQSNTVQAFNNYLRDGEKGSGRAYSIGNEKRIVFKGSQLPGPTDYKTDFTKTIKDETSVGFAKSSWVQKNQQIYNPGPGHYKDFQGNSTRYTIPKSKSISYLNTNPGAGRYEAISGMGQKKQKFSRQLSGNLIGKSQRTNFISRNKSGVGDYNILMAKTGGVSIPKANRFPKPNGNPGPGDYNMTSTLSNFNMYRKRF